jgi:hypothetical protein
MSFHLFIYFFSFNFFWSRPLALQPPCQLPPLPQPPSWHVVITSPPPHTCHIRRECKLAAAITPQGKHLLPFEAPQGTTLTLSRLTVVPQPWVSTHSDPAPPHRPAMSPTLPRHPPRHHVMPPITPPAHTAPPLWDTAPPRCASPRHATHRPLAMPHHRGTKVSAMPSRAALYPCPHDPNESKDG